MAERVTDAEFGAKVLESPVPVLIDFYGDSCVPCKRLAPQLAKVEAAPADAGDLAVVKVNTSFDREAAARYGVMGTPTLVLVKGGRELDRLVGFQRAEQVETFIKKALAEA